MGDKALKYAAGRVVHIRDERDLLSLWRARPSDISGRFYETDAIRDLNSRADVL